MAPAGTAAAKAAKAAAKEAAAKAASEAAAAADRNAAEANAVVDSHAVTTAFHCVGGGDDRYSAWRR